MWLYVEDALPMETTPLTVICSEDQLLKLCELLKSQSEIAVDTEVSTDDHLLSVFSFVLLFLGRLYIPPNLVNFGPETAENGWRVFAHLLNICIGRYITKLWHVLCSGMSLQFRITERQAGSCWALPCI